MLTNAELFDLAQMPPELHSLLEAEFPWEILGRLDAFAAAIPTEVRGQVHPTAVLSGRVFVDAEAKVGPHALIEGPAWLGRGAEVGHGAYLRGNVVLAPGAKVGHASEVKRSVFLPKAAAPHFNYVGDSVLGAKVNLGAGVKLANFRALSGTIKVGEIDTGLRKFGAALGDGVSLGCNCVTAPGTIVGARTVAYHGVMLRGIYPADTVVKLRQTLERAALH
jgi:UDP-N-acetylglucosamine diphosphorylase / glucose-1-phosphate thymidylyltransferase / UDP-N-acetylgalactosamine diphosphorylase / glucosamine-1-phosphate N-acetyltransferase / galactosamine-1-phosphate N-acetyltransferase